MHGSYRNKIVCALEIYEQKLPSEIKWLQQEIHQWMKDLA